MTFCLKTGATGPIPPRTESLLWALLMGAWALEPTQRLTLLDRQLEPGFSPLALLVQVPANLPVYHPPFHYNFRDMASLFESLTLKLANVVELATQDQGSFTPQARQALVRSVSKKSLSNFTRCSCICRKPD